MRSINFQVYRFSYHSVKNKSEKLLKLKYFSGIQFHFKMNKEKNFNRLLMKKQFTNFIFLNLALFIFISANIVLADEQEIVAQKLESFISETPSQSGAHCGFQDLVNLREHMNQLSPSVQGLVKSVLFETYPERQDSVSSPKGHFMLHFDRTGTHAVPPEDILGNGIPDYIDSAGVYLDHVWDVEINQLGFKAPPDRLGNPVQIYPIYFTSFGYYGLTTWIEPDIANLPGVNYPSYIELHNDYEGSMFYSNGLDGLKVTCAHEFNHAIQLGYNFRLDDDLFMMEMTSTWLEDYVYNDVNDYVFYLDDLFRDLFRIGFTKDSGFYPYANSLFLRMIGKKYGPQIVPEIWDNIQTNKAFDAIGDVLQEYGSSFSESQNLYAGWLYFTGSRSIIDTYFDEGTLYPELILDEGMDSFGNGLVPLGVRLVQIDPEYNQIVGASVSSSATGKFNHILNETELLKPINFNARQILSVNENDPVVVVMSNPTNDKIEDLDYTMEPQSVVIGPNPVIVKSGDGYMSFSNLPGLSTVYLFNLNGFLVRKIDGSSNDAAIWDLKDHNGAQIATGIYIYHIKADGFEKLGKISVIR